MPQCISPGRYGRCRKCSACLQSRLRSWLFRLVLEAILYPTNYVTFCTLTYSNDNLPESADVAKSQLQKFFKRVRKDLLNGEKLRYVAALERGNQGTKRYHWHCIFYGLRFCTVNRHFLSKKWGLGFIDWKPVTPGRMSYVLKYAIKGGTFLCSRCPGLGDGMIPYIISMLNTLNKQEVLNLIHSRDVTYFIDRMVDADPNRKINLSYIKSGGYPFPIHDFIKRRLPDLKDFL